MQIKSWQIALTGLVISIIIRITTLSFKDTLIGDLVVLLFFGGAIILLLHNPKLKISAKDTSESMLGGIFAIIILTYFIKMFLYGSHSISPNFIIPSLVYIFACVHYFWKKI